MNCPYCNSQSNVTNSRSHNNLSVWRRRFCKSCGALWTTKELIDLETTHKIKVSETSLEPFKRDVLFISIIDSLSHRKDRLTASSALTDTIISKILARNSALIEKDLLINAANEVLINFDPTAASVYKAKR